MPADEPTPTDPRARRAVAIRMGLLAGVIGLGVGAVAAVLGSGGTIGPVEAVLLILPLAAIGGAIIGAKVYARRD